MHHTNDSGLHETGGAGNTSEHDPRGALYDAIEAAAHVLPNQAPIRIFVHHNTLHSLEHLHFDEAVLEGARTYNTQPYQSEQAFAEHLRVGRILPVDVQRALEAYDECSDEAVFEGGPTHFELRRLRLENPFEIPRGPALDWLLEESDVLLRFHERVDEAKRAQLIESLRKSGFRGEPTERRVLERMWELLEPHARVVEQGALGIRPRDALLERTEVDADELVNPLMIRLCASFIDQGISYWRMPDTEKGLLRAFRGLYCRHLGPPDRWLRPLPVQLAQQERDGWDAERTCIEMLRQMEVPQAQWLDFIRATFLSLRGWAGMMHQLELRPDRAPVKAPPARLVDFLAVRLVLDRAAANYLEEEHLPVKTSPGPGESLEAAPQRDRSSVYEAFIVAQLAGIGPRELELPTVAATWFEAVTSMDSNWRRRLLHEAYERRHRVDVLDAMLNHARLNDAKSNANQAQETPPRFQAVFCIDDREESLRRHLEEVFPFVETYGYAGFYGVAMAYQGLEDVRPRDLCPVHIRPKHWVREVAVDAAKGDAAAARRRSLGALSHAANVGSHTLVRGGLVSSALGWASAIPLIGRALFPRLSEQVSRALHHSVAAQPLTRLLIERDPSEGPAPNGLLPGYSVGEMVDVVLGALRTIALTEGFSPLVFLIGHGSSSLNNPHESAHDCGATGGGRGGANARAFAAMGNHPEVRAELRSRGIEIPDGTYFVGGYHNTCDDTMTYYDEDLIPEELRPEYETALAAFEQARRLDAHERCRRFESSTTTLDVERALAHAQAHAVDLGQPRPEYGHATNAICFVGRRQRTRGLFLDRRAFLVSYDPTQDADGATLAKLLQAVGPVGAGISLEYYFSYVDPTGYGCGTKLPHNIVGLVGVMDGHASDLRTGLPWQMVEIHEPVRLLTVIEAEPEVLVQIATEYPEVGRLVVNRWIQVVAWSPSTGRMSVFTDDGFVPYEPERDDLPSAQNSVEYYSGRRQHLPCARIEAGSLAVGVSQASV